ncbi:hypothetical protein GCM10011415_05650 [Salipiger pallidus]|uniref:SHOCT domain-containing protein n=1 Tax=Salipiger pallidus TaxID=1775170 RepID=A0A8J2ZGQ9_9RHOB|nr:SHOCT domain-containing protein [Salipiger pallidus]GGG62271.1 hypothetical protein GCM10011415_05650 [Salipiger pallidus]
MTRLTPEGLRLVSEIAACHAVSPDAAETLLVALAAGQGTQAQFNHPELGGMGQWSQGGMTMVGDMFNNALKAQVDGLCRELSQAMVANQLFAAAPSAPQGRQSQSQSPSASLFVPYGSVGGHGWPGELGQPSSTGSQNNLRYAVFPQTRRLAIDFGGRIEVYDTGDHRIFGVSQQQHGDQSLSFTSQHGLVLLSSLTRVGGEVPGEDGQTVTDAVPAREIQSTFAPGDVAAEAPVSQDAPGIGSSNEGAGDFNSAPREEKGSNTPAAGQEGRTAPEPAEPLAPETVEMAGAKPVQAVPRSTPAVSVAAGAGDAEQIIGLIRKLADLRDGGLLSEAEFEAKKTELLSRL